MNTDINFFRELLSLSPTPDEVMFRRSPELRKQIEPLSLKEKFNLALELIPELNAYSQSSMFKSYSVYEYLAESFSLYNNITYDEYYYIVTSLSSKLVTSVLMNPSFPVELLINSEVWRYNLNPRDTYTFVSIAKIYDERRDEIIIYYRKQVPDSEYMSDEMVLKIAGSWL
jgi:hypothetical protein